MKNCAWSVACRAALAAALCGFGWTAVAGTNETVLVVGGHPDDLVGSAGLCLLMRDRFDVHLADFTRGDRGQKRGAELAPLAKRRTAEELAACKLAGITPHFVDEVNGLAFASQEACERLAKLIGELRPRAIIMHWPVDIHMDHVMSTAATLKALEMAKLARAPELIFFEETWQSKNFPVHRLVDITSVWPQKVEIIRTYACQNVNDGIVQNKYRDAKFRGSQLFPPEDGRLAEAYSVYQAPVQGTRSIFDELPPPGPMTKAY